MKDNKGNNYSVSLITVGKTRESTEAAEIKRYIGVASTKVLAFNPTKEERDKLMGFEFQSEPEYVGSDDNGKFARVTLVVETDPEVNNGIDIKNLVSFTLRPVPAYSRDKASVQVIDNFGNARFIPVEDAKAGKKILNKDGSPSRFGQYRIAKVGEVDLTHFFRAYLNVKSPYNYKNGVWSFKENASDGEFKFDDFDKLANGDFSEINDALKLQPNNKVKLLYGIRTTEEGKQYQAVITRDQFVLPNYAGAKAYAKLEKDLLNAKQSGSWPTTELKVQELAEWDVKPTDLSQSAPADDPLAGGTDSTPWDM